MRYTIVAEADRDLERASGRLELAALLTRTPAGLLPMIACLGQGRIVDSGPD